MLLKPPHKEKKTEKKRSVFQQGDNSDTHDSLQVNWLSYTSSNENTAILVNSLAEPPC